MCGIAIVQLDEDVNMIKNIGKSIDLLCKKI